MASKCLSRFLVWAASWTVLASPVASAAAPWVVAADGSGDFTSVQAAIDAVPSFAEERTVIYIKNGVYKEKIDIPSGKLISLIGEDPEKTILTYDDYAQRLGPGGQEIGTSGSYSVRVMADDFYAESLTFENSAGWGNGVGQAVALSVQGDRAVFYNVRILGNQDTLYTPGEGRQYYKDCYIEGNVDFIFGSATAFFDSCQIHSVGGGYITAASTPAGAAYGYVFLNSRLTGNGTADVYLGRPWRPYANVLFVNTWMDRHIRPEGWHNWNDPAREQTARYAEYNSTGPGAGAARRVSWARVGGAEEAESITVESVLAGADGWDPRSVIANHLPYRGQPERPSLLVRLNRPGANGRTRVSGLLEVDVEIEVAEASKLNEVVVAIDGKTLYAGRDLDALRSLPVETATLSDGRHRFSVTVSYGEYPPLESATTFEVRNHWELEQEMKPPEDAGWFGVIDYLRTKERSEGWVYETDQPDRFFGDATRLRRAGATSEFLVWETPGLETAVVELYARSGRDVADGVELALSPEGDEWRIVPFDVEGVEEAGDWLRVRIAVATPDPHGVRAFRLTLREGVPADRLQLGRVWFRGVGTSGS